MLFWLHPQVNPITSERGVIGVRKSLAKQLLAGHWPPELGRPFSRVALHVGRQVGKFSRVHVCSRLLAEGGQGPWGS